MNNQMDKIYLCKHRRMALENKGIKKEDMVDYVKKHQEKYHQEHDIEVIILDEDESSHEDHDELIKKEL